MITENKQNCKHKNKEIALDTCKYILYYCPDCNMHFKSYNKNKIQELIKEDLRK